MKFIEELFCVSLENMCVERGMVAIVFDGHSSTLNHEQDKFLGQNVKNEVIVVRDVHNLCYWRFFARL